MVILTTGLLYLARDKKANVFDDGGGGGEIR